MLCGESCPSLPLDIENVCPNIFSEKTGSYVRSAPKYISSEHPNYDVIVPEAARGKTNVYCGHPGLVCPGSPSSTDSCYFFSNQDSQSWEVARDRCDELGGYLVAIETPSELSRIREDVLISHYGVTTFQTMWTGLNDRSSEGVYTWERAGGTLPVSSSMWMNGQPWAPSGQDQDCGGFTGYAVLDNVCNELKQYLCEFSE
ncbi:perlucin-like protein [Diadema antillarum]|uniref:perlucin-like protein n=1 Tax=Diadema antillarum TaxID=105358 RepID=UPI003A8599A9